MSGALLGITGAIGSGKSTLAAALAHAEPDSAIYETYHVIADIANAFNRALKAELAFDTTHDSIELANQVLIWLPDSISEYLHLDVAWNQLAITKHDTLVHPELYRKLFIYVKHARNRQRLLDTRISPVNKQKYRALLQWIGGYLVVKISKTIWYDELFRRIERQDENKRLIIISGVRYPSDAEVVRQRGGRIVKIERSSANNNASDVTEAQRKDIQPDITIVNNGALDHLQQLARTLYSDITHGKIKKRYST